MNNQTLVKHMDPLHVLIHSFVISTDRFNFSLKDATVLEALPYLVAGVTVQIGGFVADWLRGTGLMTTTTVY